MKNRLRVLRAEREWSQADLAERLGVSRQTVNAIETGKYDPSLPLAFKIARLFGLPIEAIFQPEEAAGGGRQAQVGGQVQGEGKGGTDSAASQP
jgi:putative transcriptional regulator